MVDVVTALRSTAALAFLLALSSGCSVSNPPGYDELSAAQPLLVQATPWHAYGYAPLHWSLSDGRQVSVDVDRIASGSGLGARFSDMAFEVVWDDGSAPALHCETDPAGPGVPETRFGCWSAADEGASVQFWMAPDAGCSVSQANVAASLGTACWTGVLQTPTDHYAVEFGHFERAGSPVGRLSWLDGAGQVALAADVVAEAGMELFPGGGRPAPDDMLVLQTIALHWWWHASRAD